MFPGSFPPSLPHFLFGRADRDGQTFYKGHNMNIFVGNISFSTTEEDLQQLFEQYGAVENVSLIMDRYTGRSRGFGFVEMANDNEARSAITKLNGTELHDRALTVNEARPREPRRDRDRDRDYDR